MTLFIDLSDLFGPPQIVRAKPDHCPAASALPHHLLLLPLPRHRGETAAASARPPWVPGAHQTDSASGHVRARHSPLAVRAAVAPDVRGLHPAGRLQGSAAALDTCQAPRAPLAMHVEPASYKHELHCWRLCWCCGLSNTAFAGLRWRRWFIIAGLAVGFALWWWRLLLRAC